MLGLGITCLPRRNQQHPPRRNSTIRDNRLLRVRTRHACDMHPLSRDGHHEARALAQQTLA